MPDGHALAHSVRNGGSVSDVEFDRIYPAWIRRVSDMHWTPYEVARRAAELLVVDSTTRVLDVGSGAGKFCLIGSLATKGRFFGVEQRAALVAAAERAAQACHATRVHFIHGNLTSIDWSGFDAFYLFNPFYEHIAHATPLIDEPIDRSPGLFSQYVATTALKLATARVGTRVATYQGYGGVMPAEYRRLSRESFHGYALELWRKERQPVAPERPRPRRSDPHRIEGPLA